MYMRSLTRMRRSRASFKNFSAEFVLIQVPVCHTQAPIGEREIRIEFDRMLERFFCRNQFGFSRDLLLLSFAKIGFKAG
jgi:hypothetical protein